MSGGTGSSSNPMPKDALPGLLCALGTPLYPSNLPGSGLFISLAGSGTSRETAIVFFRPLSIGIKSYGISIQN